MRIFRLPLSSFPAAPILTVLFLLGAGSLCAAKPVITSATSVDVYYDAQNTADTQFAYRIVATDALEWWWADAAAALLVSVLLLREGWASFALSSSQPSR